MPRRVLLLVLVLLMSGCVVPLMKVGRRTNDPQTDESVTILDVKGRKVTLSDGRQVTLAGVNLEGLTPEQQAAFSEGLPGGQVLVNDLGGGLAQLVLINTGLYPRPPNWESYAIPIIPIVTWLYPVRLDLAQQWIASGAIRAKPEEVAGVLATLLAARRRSDREPRPPSNTRTLDEIYVLAEDSAREQRVGIYETPNDRLLRAAQRGDVEGIERALSEGADVNAVFEEGYTPLMAAAQASHAGAVRLLLERGARRERANAFGRTAFDLGNGLDPTAREWLRVNH